MYHDVKLLVCRAAALAANTGGHLILLHSSGMLPIQPARELLGLGANACLSKLYLQHWQCLQSQQYPTHHSIHR